MFGFSRGVSTDDNLVRTAIDRGVERVFPSREFLEKRLRSKERLTIYLGIDPTGPSLHLGHAIVLKKLRDFQRLGHRVVLLIGDFTATIGDPTGKLAARQSLTRAAVLANARRYRAQASTFLKFFGSNCAVVKHNSLWLQKLTLADVVQLAAHVTVDQMAKRDMFVERAASGKPTFLHEFLYPLLQGYDSVAMAVDGEVGGNDQTFNMLVGRDLESALLKKEKFVIAMKLLEDTSGKKMGKTEGNMVSLADSPKDMFGKVMSWTDGMIPRGFELCTDVSAEEIVGIEEALAQKTVNPRDVKVRLARAITAAFHGEKEAARAAENFGAAGDAREVHANGTTDTYYTVCVREGIVSSKSDLKRLFAQGAVTDAGTGERVGGGPDTVISQSIGLRVGKKHFLNITVDA
jgi:tyrosyl-tRNA synthetase